MTLTPPEEVETLAARRALETGHRDVSAYLADLIGADVREAADPVLEAALIDGVPLLETMHDGTRAQLDRSDAALARALAYFAKGSGA